MSKRIINTVTNSIKSKLSFDDYKPSMQPNLIEELRKFVEKKKAKEEQVAIPKAIKVKRTFYILESIADELDEFYARKLSEKKKKKKIDKSDIVTQALKNLLSDKNSVVEEF